MIQSAGKWPGCFPLHGFHILFPLLNLHTDHAMLHQSQRRTFHWCASLKVPGPEIEAEGRKGLIRAVNLANGELVFQEFNSKVSGKM